MGVLMRKVGQEKERNIYIYCRQETDTDPVANSGLEERKP